ncbi:MAG: DnaA/Hda family protein, partial [Elioraea sp.]|nr:DnaA/Hda family protein [Elioraea sp.]
PAQQFNTWIRPLSAEPEDTEPGALVLTAPNRFVAEMVRERFAARIGRLAEEASGRETLVKVVLARPAQAASRAAPAPAPALGAERAPFSRQFSFDNFVTGKANQLARAAALQVAENPGLSYNPLFIYGGVGLGKTHLLLAIGNHVGSRRPQAKIRYIHAEQYVTDVVRA